MFLKMTLFVTNLAMNARELSVLAEMLQLGRFGLQSKNNY